MTDYFFLLGKLKLFFLNSSLKLFEIAKKREKNAEN